MSFDDHVMVGHYVKARVPKWVDGGTLFDSWIESYGKHEPFDVWLNSHGVKLRRIDNIDGEPLGSDVCVWVDCSEEKSCSLVLELKWCGCSHDAPTRDPKAFEAKFSEAMAKLRELYGEVKVCYGVLVFTTES